VKALKTIKADIFRIIIF